MDDHSQHAGDWDQQLRAHKLAEGTDGGSGGPGKYHAARSHDLHAEYGGRWDAAYQELGGRGKPFLDQLSGRSGEPSSVAGGVPSPSSVPLTPVTRRCASISSFMRA